MKTKSAYVLIIIIGVIVAGASLSHADIRYLMNTSYWTRLTLIGGFFGLLVTGIGLGGLFVDRTKPTTELIAQVIETTINTHMDELKKQVVEEILKKRGFQKAHRPNEVKTN